MNFPKLSDGVPCVWLLFISFLSAFPRATSSLVFFELLFFSSELETAPLRNLRDKGDPVVDSRCYQRRTWWVGGRLWWILCLAGLCRRTPSRALAWRKGWIRKPTLLATTYNHVNNQTKKRKKHCSLHVLFHWFEASMCGPLHKLCEVLVVCLTFVLSPNLHVIIVKIKDFGMPL